MKILWQDIVVILAFILLIGSGVATKFIYVKIETLTTAAEYIESNPIMRQALNIGYLIMAIQVIGIAFLGAFYYLLRRKYTMTMLLSNRQLLDFYTITLFIIFLQYFANDFAIFLSVFGGG